MRAISLLTTCVLLLSLSATAPDAATVQGRVVDSFTQQAPIHHFDVNNYNAAVQLQPIPLNGKSEILQDVDPEGDGSFLYEDVPAGKYRILVSFRAGYARYTGPSFVLDADERLDVGTIVLDPPPVIAIALTPCDTVTADFKCPFRVTIQSTVGRPQELKAWLHVYAANTGSPIGHTQTVAVEEYFRLGARKKRVLNWLLPLGPASAPATLGVCGELYVSVKGGPLGAHYETVGYNFLFCATRAEGNVS